MAGPSQEEGARRREAGVRLSQVPRELSTALGQWTGKKENWTGIWEGDGGAQINSTTLLLMAELYSKQ